MAKGLDRKRLSQIQGRVKNVSEAKTLLHMLVWGRVKSGKTAFACTGPKPVMFMAERGQMTVRRIPDLQVFPLNPDGTFRRVVWRDSYDFLYYLKYGDHDRETAIVDTMSALTRIAMRFILRDEEARDDAREPGVADMRTWGRLATAMIEFMEELEVVCKTRGMHLIYTAQERKLKEDDVEDEGASVVPDFSPGVRSFIVEKPDILARTFIDGDEEVVDEEANVEAALRYGMMFRDPDYYVGERVTPPGDAPWLPKWAYDVTVPKLIRRIERSKSAPEEGNKVRRSQGRTRKSQE